MHINSFLIPREDSSNFPNQTRGSSMFSKRPQFGQNYNTEFQKNRPVSVSKSIPGSTENELMKWIPLIKMVRKIQSRVRKDYLFLWCRLENMTGIKQKIIDFNKENCVQKSNLSTLPVQSQLSLKSVNQVSKKSSFDQNLAPTMITDLPSKVYKEVFKDIDVKQSQKSLFQKDNQNELEKKQHQKNLHIPKLIDTISCFQSRICQQQIKEGFREIRSFSNKKLSIEKFQKIQFKQSKRNNLFNPIRMIKKHSHDIMKAQIVGNMLKNLIKRTKVQTVRYLITRPKESKETASIKLENQLNLAQLLLKCSFLEIEDPTPKPIQSLAHSSPKQLNLQAVGKQHIFKPIEIKQCPNPSKPLKMKMKNFSHQNIAPFSKFRQDKTVLKTFQNESPQQRMKKLNRIYPQQPFFELPDISQITLFNSTINSNPALNHLMSPQAVQKKFNLNFASQFQNSQETSRTEEKIHCLQMSPKFEEKMSQDESELIQQRAVQKSSSHGKIIYLKHSNSANLKSNPHTPSSTKKLVGMMFSKKKSVELFSKDSITKNFQSKLSSSKSTIVKKCEILAEVKQQKSYESNNKKINLMASKEKYKGATSVSNRKADKENIECQELCKTQSKAEKNQKLSCNRQKYGGSSKVVEKVMDLSAKRMGTTKKQPSTLSKKENQSLYSNEKNSSKKSLYHTKNNSAKQNQLSEFNTLSSKKVISYQDFIKMYPGKTQESSNQKPLMQISQNEPIFEPIQISDNKAYASKELGHFYQSCSAQLPRDYQEMGENKCKKLRSKIDKMELNTARKMKMQIENMISQRKKSSIGVLKF